MIRGEILRSLLLQNEINWLLKCCHNVDAK
ncbi:hypothetical protein EBL_c33870 [Shimwellia blattae DSM 4481 = NBRC 105725]|uniref:Uncharacterized protein n=1 Tax=Shimwellia blattae (strain ATCC 29907 / DSM 4481 / JCM 1650 / NBRC 105725 / CDC 9005-74) TaxID=630626 RepID=I2BD43_SHIBC|nr:hypothetical protein EBL_c33870 [Shimwellia blattae DSM 4481 = NBRC 105725]